MRDVSGRTDRPFWLDGGEGEGRAEGDPKTEDLVLGEAMVRKAGRGVWFGRGAGKGVGG